jgi:hypothetical protein
MDLGKPEKRLQIRRGATELPAAPVEQPAEQPATTDSADA